MSTPSFAARRLRRLARGGAAAAVGADGGSGPVCDLCAAPLAAAHRHLLDLRTDSVRCACPACSLLMDHAEAGGTHYRLLPAGARRLEGCALGDAVWAGLGVPVGLAFFTRSGATAAVTAAYPGPLGLMRSGVEAAAWARVEAVHPALPALADDVEALLVHRDRAGGGEDRHWIAPLDDCYRLAALVRGEWKGLGGGPDVWRRIDEFFDALATSPSPDTQEASWASP